METSARSRELERVYQSRRGHIPKISLSDDNHHATEAIADMYGDDGYNRRESRPLSFVRSPLNESIEANGSYIGGGRNSPARPPLSKTMGNERTPGPVNGAPKPLSRPSPPLGGETRPQVLKRTSSDIATQQFPLNNIDYESSPAAVAQELSNLQAIRRMSMDVNAADPDLPSFNQTYAVPTVAPSHTADEDDASRLFWVPARLHPELAPKEFKTFLEERVTRIRRRSGGEDTLSPDGLQRQGSGGGLRRKKSMLSRQIDGPVGYKDGAERLERKRSAEGRPSDPTVARLQQLESIVNDPSSLMRKLSIEAARISLDSGSDDRSSEDMPILPPAPAGQTLKRSTRTQYRKGSLRKGDQGYPTRRGVGRRIGQDGDDSPASSPVTGTFEAPPLPLSRVQTEPNVGSSPPADKLLPLSDRGRTPSGLGPSASNEELVYRPSPVQPLDPPPQASSTSASFTSRIASNGRTTAKLPGYTSSAPQTTATYASPTLSTQQPPQPQQLLSLERPPLAPIRTQQVPDRKLSSERFAKGSQEYQVAPPSPGRSVPVRPPASRQDPTPRKPNQTFDDFTSHPSPLPGSSSSHTADLTLIPTFNEEKRPEKKIKDRKEGSDGGSSTRKTSWGWLLGTDEKEKEKRKEQEEKEREAGKKARAKLTKANDKAHDNTRLDLLQSSIDAGKPRESLVLDRDSIRLDEERKKETGRKSSGGEKKEKEAGLFSSLFGGTKKTKDRDTSGKKSSSHRSLAPEPPPRILKPDIDYNWTRFSILEERAIYRMAHIKLANPRRALHSQVLLSNFMYSYLAKVQQMHPQIQIAQSPAQKQAQKQPQQQQEQRDADQRQQQQQSQQQQQMLQPEEFYQYQRYQEQQARSDPSTQSPPPPSNASPVYVEDHDQDYQYQEDHGRPDPRTSHSQTSHSINSTSHSNTSIHNPGTASVNGNGYSVASGPNYLGYPGGLRGKQSEPYFSQTLFEDTEERRDDEMW